jgi:hypothetical protein
MNAAYPKHFAPILFASAAIAFGGTALAATQATAPAGANVVKFSPNMPASALASRPNSDLIELSDGRRLRLGDVRRLTATLQKMRSTPIKPLPAALRARPALSGTPINNSVDLADALKRPDQETLQLASGRRLTVGQLKLLQPQIEKELGRSLVDARRGPSRSGPAIKVGAKADWKSLLARPDSTVLEAPDGARITVGEIKQALRETTPAAPRR